MSVLHNNPFLLASGSPTDPTFPVQRSVRLRSSASAYFARTPASNGNQKTWTWSCWLKSAKNGGNQLLLNTAVSGSSFGLMALSASTWRNANDTIHFESYVSNVPQFAFETTPVFRDPSSWYHIVINVDTTQATASNRVKIYVNGVQITAFATATYPSLNLDVPYFNSTTAQQIGTISTGGGGYLDGYLTEVNFIDGQALTPSSFGGYNTGTGVWEPRKYSGTYGTNGFYLNFQDNSGATATTIGKDSSGNSNNWTPNGIVLSPTTSTSYDSMTDVPTLTSAINANFPVFNNLIRQDTGYTTTISAANLDASITYSSGANMVTIPVTMQTGSSGKWYWEITATSTQPSGGSTGVGISTMASSPVTTTLPLNSYIYVGSDGSKTSYTGSSVNAAYGASYTTNNVIGVALDIDAGTLTFYKNNTSQGVAFTGLAATNYFPIVSSNGTGTRSYSINCGQRPFTYTPPSGFVALNTFNLPEPTIPSGDDYHKIYTYTGNGGGLQVGEIQKPASLFNLDRSLRFRNANSAYLNRTPASTTNRQIYTWSGWVKLGILGANNALYPGYISTNERTTLGFQSDILYFIDTKAGSSAFVGTDAVFRNPSIWYHIVLSVDTTQATAANRTKIYINGVQQTLTGSYVAQNTNTYINQNVIQYIGNDAGSAGRFFDGYLADVYLIDGQALTPTDFGAYDGNFYWTPKAYTGTYGTNGFHLEFEDNSAATAATIGKDTSGNVNNWTPSGISVTAGNTYDSMTDVPTQTSTDVANFATFNPLDTNSGTISNANLSSSLTVTGTTGRQSRSTFIFPSSGKFYFEVKPSSLAVVGQIGVVKSSAATNGGNGITPAFSTGDVYLYLSNGQKQDGVTASAYGASYTTSNLIGVAVDIDAGTLTFYKDNASQGIAYSGLTLSNYYPVVHSAGSVGTASYDINFGQRPFTYTPPTGFKSINSFNIAEVTTDLETPDFVWIKSRSAATSHALFNSVSGVNKYLSSNATTAETTDVNSLIQFNKNGFLLGNAAIVNTSAATYVASAWKAGGAAVTNTAGSITSQVSANQKAGFSIVTYTGTGANATVGHGLGVAPKFIITKSRSAVQSWYVYHVSIGGTKTLYLNLTDAAGADSRIWNNTDPTSSVFSIGTVGPNASAVTQVAYCFSEIAGFSKFGSYTGTGNTDGQFVYTGFRPRLIITKQTGAISNWSIHDSTRAPYNLTINELYADTSDVEYTGANDSFDLLSNGFKPRSAGTPTNASGGTYIYIAFAEVPYKFALGR